MSAPSRHGLERWGWSPAWQAELERLNPPGDQPPARVTVRARGQYRVQTAAGERPARLAGRLRKEGRIAAVGDWVLLRPEQPDDVIVELLPRSSQLSRKVAGAKTAEQVVAANIDAVFVVMGLDGDFNLARLERFIVMASQSGAEVVVVLTKADLAESPEEMRWQVEDVAAGLPVHTVSVPEDSGLAPLAYYLEAGRTVALVGSSGVGKSTLLNHLCGEEVMRTGKVREDDDRGRHTTTHRELVRLPTGGMLIDNPGVREIQLWSDEDDHLGDAFSDIEELAGRCRFRDCGHREEPGCAVNAAVETGELDPRRLASYRELEREMEFLERRRDEVARRKQDRQLGAFYKRVQAEKKKTR